MSDTENCTWRPPFLVVTVGRGGCHEAADRALPTIVCRKGAGEVMGITQVDTLQKWKFNINLGAGVVPGGGTTSPTAVALFRVACRCFL